MTPAELILVSGAAAATGTPDFAIDLLHDLLQAQILLAHITAVGIAGYFLLSLFFFFPAEGVNSAPSLFLTNF